MADILFHFWAGIRHTFTAWHTGGEGVHSPYLFEWVRMGMYDRHGFYCWNEIEALRRRLCASKETISFQDWGSGAKVKGSVCVRKVSDIARHSLKPASQAQLLFRLVNWLGHTMQHEEKERRGLEIVELGTSLGVTTAYLAAADSRNRVTSLEGSEAVAKMAMEGWKSLTLGPSSAERGVGNIRCIVGNIDDTLPAYVRELKGEGVDLAFVDANHTGEATLRYVNQLLPCLRDKSVLVLDDIHYSRDMEEAWKTVQTLPQVTSTMDVFDMGLVFFDPHYLRKHYRMRI